MKDWDETLSAIRRGDERAFQQLFYGLYRQLYRYAYRFVGDSQVAEELAQDAFVKFWENRQTTVISKSVEAYLFTSVRNLSLNYLKSRYVQQKPILKEHPEELISDSPPVENSDQTDLLKRLNEGLNHLPEKCRIIFQLSRNSGLTYQEIADELGISKETVKSQVKIALQKLRTFF